MTRLPTGYLPFALLFLFALAGPAGQTLAQSDRELREENQRLQTQVRDLQAELAAARDQLADLRKQIEELRQQLAASSAARSAASQPRPAPEPEKVSIDESVPNASPRALLRAIKSDFDEKMKGKDPSHTGRKERLIYLQQLEPWIAGVNRQFRAPIEWHVELLQPETKLVIASASVQMLDVQAVDPVTGTLLGPPLTVEAPRSMVDRLRRVYDREGELPALVLKGVLEPRVMVNETMLTPGPFDADRFIGPLAEFAYAVRIKSLAVPEPPKAE